MLIFLGKHLGRPRVGAVGTDERAQCSLGIGSMCFFWLTAYVLERATSEKDESLFSPFTVFFEPGRKLGWYFSALNHSPMKGKTIQSWVKVITTYWYKGDFLWMGERATFLSVFRVRMKLYLHPTTELKFHSFLLRKFIENMKYQVISYIYDCIKNIL